MSSPQKRAIIKRKLADFVDPKTLDWERKKQAEFELQMARKRGVRFPKQMKADLVKAKRPTDRAEKEWIRRQEEILGVTAYS